MISVCALGDYAHRQPLAYPQIRARCRDSIALTNDPKRADMVLLAHSKDLAKHGRDLHALSRDQRVILLSEEPFWDTVWGADPLTRQLSHPTEAGILRVTQLNHMTSTVFAFRSIPYFLLTDHHFATRYRLWFSETAQLRASDWMRHFKSVANDVAFMMAHRSSPRYAVSFGVGAVRSLCNERTAIAEAFQGPRVLKQGMRWHDRTPRQSSTDWHLDKYLTLKARFRFIGAIENTHERNYVTEKIFDAWAAGGIPIYIADAEHRVSDLAVPGSWINLRDVALGQVQAHLENSTQDKVFCERYAEQHQRLAELFTKRQNWDAELDRLKTCLVSEFESILTLSDNVDA